MGEGGLRSSRPCHCVFPNNRKSTTALGRCQNYTASQEEMREKTGLRGKRGKSNMNYRESERPWGQAAATVVGGIGARLESVEGTFTTSHRAHQSVLKGTSFLIHSQPCLWKHDSELLWPCSLSSRCSPAASQCSPAESSGTGGCLSPPQQFMFPPALWLIPILIFKLLLSPGTLSWPLY